MMSSHAGLDGHRHGHAVSMRSSGASERLKLALAITSGVMVLEVIGGLYSNSLALLADAGHMLTDVGALGLSLFAVWFSSRPATPQKTFGFYRVEILAALLNGVMLVAMAIFILYRAYGRLVSPPEVRAGWMLAVASIGLFANLTSAWLLFRKQSESLNVRGAFFHVVGDALGSVGAILASLAIMFFGWLAADGVISAVVALLILWSSWILIRDAVDILLESTPSHIDLGKLKDQLIGADGVLSVHDLHVWTLTSGVVAMSCHVVVGRDGPVSSEVLGSVQRIAHDRFSIDHTTVQIEGERADGETIGCDCRFGAG